jgi:hypothetical protein
MAVGWRAVNSAKAIFRAGEWRRQVSCACETKRLCSVSVVTGGEDRPVRRVPPDVGSCRVGEQEAFQAGRWYDKSRGEERRAEENNDDDGRRALFPVCVNLSLTRREVEDSQGEGGIPNGRLRMNEGTAVVDRIEVSYRVQPPDSHGLAAPWPSKHKHKAVRPSLRFCACYPLQCAITAHRWTAGWGRLSLKLALFGPALFGRSSITRLPPRFHCLAGRSSAADPRCFPARVRQRLAQDGI